MKQIILNLGAGVQSSTLAVMASRGMVDPMPIAAIFADTNWEPRAVYDHLDWLEQELAFPIHRVSAGDMRALTASGKNLTGHDFFMAPVFVRGEDGRAAITKRTCTAKLKIEPIAREIRRILGVRPLGGFPAWVDMEQWIGISADEVHRAKVRAKTHVTPRYPLIEMGMTRRDCLSLWSEWYPDHPLPRSACIGCPFHTDQEWADMPADELADAIEVERLMRSSTSAERFGGEVTLHHSLVPLGDIDWSARPRQADFFDDCNGYCFV